MQKILQSDTRIIHRMLPAIQFGIRVFSNIIIIFILTAFCVNLTAIFSPSDKMADSRPLRTVCRGNT
jgi:hypothetical protein